MTNQGRRVVVSDADLRHATLVVVAHEGVDAATIPRIATSAGVAPASVYRRYDSGPDAVFDLWREDLRSHAQRLMRASLVTQDAEAENSEWLVHELRHPSDLTRALMALLAVTRRLGPIGNDISAEFEDDLDALITEHTDLPGVMVVAHVLAPFGALLLDSVSVGVGDAVAGMIGRFTSEYHNQRHWQESSVGYSYVAPSSFNLTTGDAAVDDLRNATFRVVARYGFEGATATRISREAKRSLTSAYRRVGSKDALLADAVAAALSSDLGFTGAENATSLPFARPDRLRRAWQATMNQIDDRNRTNRAFVLELLAAVGATASIEVPAKQWGASVQTRFRRAAEAAAPAEAESLVHLWGFRMAAGIGGLLLSFAAPRVIHRFDPLPILSANDAVCFPGSA